MTIYAGFTLAELKVLRANEKACFELYKAKHQSRLAAINKQIKDTRKIKND